MFPFPITVRAGRDANANANLNAESAETPNVRDGMGILYYHSDDAMTCGSM